jgi:hypothetical protein
VIAHSGLDGVQGSPSRGRGAGQYGGPSKQFQVGAADRLQQSVVIPASGSQSCIATGNDGQKTPQEQLAPS